MLKIQGELEKVPDKNNKFQPGCANAPEKRGSPEPPIPCKTEKNNKMQALGHYTWHLSKGQI